MSAETAIDHAGPRAPVLGQWFGTSLARLIGWKAIGDFPSIPKAVFIASPHTSLWDGIIMVIIAWSMGVRLSWITKKETVRFPFKRFVTYFGAVPVDRSKRSDTVSQVAQQFKERDGMYLAVAPAGTRKKRDHWRSGFYHMAVQADVPFICGFLDYKRKEGGIRAIVHPTGDIDVDMARLREVYAGVVAKYPPLMTHVRLKSETPADTVETSTRGIA
jgi:1-acyl-sn-glycerol-3-phosphate acyltransferase